MRPLNFLRDRIDDFGDENDLRSSESLKASMLVFNRSSRALFASFEECITDRRTDKASYRDSRTHLKTQFLLFYINVK